MRAATDALSLRSCHPTRTEASEHGFASMGVSSGATVAQHTFANSSVRCWISCLSHSLSWMSAFNFFCSEDAP